MNIWIWIREYEYLNMNMWIWLFEYDYVNMIMLMWICDYEYVNMNMWICHLLWGLCYIVPDLHILSYVWSYLFYLTCIYAYYRIVSFEHRIHIGFSIPLLETNAFHFKRKAIIKQIIQTTFIFANYQKKVIQTQIIR